MHMYKYVLFKKSKIYIKTFKTLLRLSITRPSSWSIYCAVQRESHAHKTILREHILCCAAWVSRCTA